MSNTLHQLVQSKLSAALAEYKQAKSVQEEAWKEMQLSWDAYEVKAGIWLAANKEFTAIRRECDRLGLLKYEDYDYFKDHVK